MTDEAEFELMKAFDNKGVICGNELIVFKEFCNDFINAAKLAGLVVIGIEGFHLLKDGSVKPNMDEIADFSDIAYSRLSENVDTCFDAASNFIGHMIVKGESDGYCFTLVDP